MNEKYLEKTIEKLKATIGDLVFEKAWILSQAEVFDEELEECKKQLVMKELEIESFKKEREILVAKLKELEPQREPSVTKIKRLSHNTDIYDADWVSAQLKDSEVVVHE